MQISSTSSKDNLNNVIIKKPVNVQGKSRNIDGSERGIIIENKVETNNEIKSFVFKKTKRLNKSFNAKSELETISP
jgi:hypothetical protein